MIIQGIGIDEAVEVVTPKGERNARLFVLTDGDLSSLSLSSNSLRVLAKLAEAAADELDARSIGL